MLERLTLMSNSISKRRKCAICDKWMEVGERFEFVEFVYHRRPTAMPVHPEHVVPKVVAEKLEKVQGRVVDAVTLQFSGMVSMFRYLLNGYKVVQYKQRGLNTLVLLQRPGFDKYVLWVI